jgi:hypothetical protein
MQVCRTLITTLIVAAGCGHDWAPSAPIDVSPNRYGHGKPMASDTLSDTTSSWAPVALLTVTLPASSLTVGATTQASAAAFDATGQSLYDAPVTWTSSDSSVATVSSSGLVTAIGAGTATISATIDGQRGSAGLTVPAPVSSTSCSANPHTRLVAVSSATQLSAALQGAQPGDLIELADGRYAGRFSSTAAGLRGQRITLCGTRNAILDAGSLSSSGYALTIQGNYWVLDGFTVTNAEQGVRLEGSSWSTVRRLAIYNIGQEALNVRKFASHDTLEANLIHDTGRVTAEYGEGIYVGSYNGAWASLTGGQPDRSDSTVVRNNVIGPNVTAEAIDVKEGTTGGLLEGNTFDGRGMVMSQPWVDSWVELKGNGYTVRNNRGTTSLRDGFQTFQQIPGWGNDNVFTANVGDLQAAGYGIRVSGVTGTLVRCDNTVTNAGSGLSNVGCR